jgi:outer membrane protein
VSNFSRIAVAAVLASAALLSAPVHAEEGAWVVRLRAVDIIPANKSDPIAALNIPADQVEVSKKWIPDIDFEYFFTPNWSTELVLTVPQKHDVSVNAGGTKIPLGTFKHLPPTLTAKYNFIPDGAFRPYVGVGINLTLLMNVDLAVPGAGVEGSPLVLKLENHSIGAAAQVGADIKLADHWFANVDAKYVQIRSDVTAPALGVRVTRVKVDPWLLGVGIAYRF